MSEDTLFFIEMGLVIAVFITIGFLVSNFSSAQRKECEKLGGVYFTSYGGGNCTIKYPLIGQ